MATKKPHEHNSLRHNLLILAATYTVALAVLNFGNMNPYVVALMPCLAFTISSLVKR